MKKIKIPSDAVPYLSNGELTILAKTTAMMVNRHVFNVLRALEIPVGAISSDSNSSSSFIHNSSYRANVDKVVTKFYHNKILSTKPYAPFLDTGGQSRHLKSIKKTISSSVIESTRAMTVQLPDMAFSTEGMNDSSVVTAVEGKHALADRQASAIIRWSDRLNRKLLRARLPIRISIEPYHSVDLGDGRPHAVETLLEAYIALRRESIKKGEVTPKVMKISRSVRFKVAGQAHAPRATLLNLLRRALSANPEKYEDMDFEDILVDQGMKPEDIFHPRNWTSAFASDFLRTTSGIPGTGTGISEADNYYEPPAKGLEEYLFLEKVITAIPDYLKVASVLMRISKYEAAIHDFQPGAGYTDVIKPVPGESQSSGTEAVTLR